MAQGDQFAVKYALYSHYQRDEKLDFDKWKETHSPDDLEGVKYLVKHFKALEELLSSPGYEGILILFYSPGLVETLDGIRRRLSKEELLTDDHVAFAQAVADHVHLQLETRGELRRRVRFVTSLDLFAIFARVNDIDAASLPLFVVGEIEGIRYDTPKFIEAIARLRLLGNGVPVFRIDWDALFRGKENWSLPDLGLFKPIAVCLLAYRLRLADPTVATFLFSASYDARALKSGDALTRAEKFFAWSRAFATRIFPAIPVIKGEIDSIQKRPVDQQAAEWWAYCSRNFDDKLARKFYGLKDCVDQTDGVSGIAAIGAHPWASVISGALLCLSDGAILDLPPFSNFAKNVSWIDDHLKYSLHRELRHFTSIDLRIDPKLSDARLDDVVVCKARPQIDEGFPAYVLGNYLPTLLRGTLMDAWITPNALLKYRPDELSADRKNEWLAIKRSGESDAVLPAAMQDAMGRGEFDEISQRDLKSVLRKVSLDRLNEVRKQWIALTNGDHDTFASIWAKGTVTDYFPTMTGISCGIAAAGVSPTAELTALEQLNPYLKSDLDMVADDAIKYVRWTIRWPKMVQIVRYIEQGTLRTDMSWEPNS